MTSISKSRGHSGAVLVELAIVIIPLILLLFGVFELGRIMSQVSWFGQTAYLATLAAGEVSTGQSATSANGTFDTVYNWQNSYDFDSESLGHQKSRLCDTPDRLPEFRNRGNNVQDVSVRARADMPLLMKFIPLSVGTTMVGPYLLPLRPPTNLDRFSNYQDSSGDPLYFDCNNVLVSNPVTDTCPSGDVGAPTPPHPPFNRCLYVKYKNTPACQQANVNPD